jgi:hypothetical protein
MSLSTNSTIPASLLPSSLDSSLNIMRNTRIDYKCERYGGKTVRGLSIVQMSRNRSKLQARSIQSTHTSTSKLASMGCNLCHIPGKAFHPYTNQHPHRGDDWETASRSIACAWHQTNTGSKSCRYHRRMKNDYRSLCCYMKQSTTIAGLNSHFFSTPRQRPPPVPY